MTHDVLLWLAGIGGGVYLLHQTMLAILFILES